MSYLYFSFDADSFDTDIVTKELEVEPTSVMVKKDPVPKSTPWNYRINAGNSIDLENYLEKLIDVFEEKIAVINQLKKELELETYLLFVLDINIDPDASTPYFGLNKRAIGFLAQTGTEAHFDLYMVDMSGGAVG